MATRTPLPRLIGAVIVFVVSLLAFDRVFFAGSLALRRAAADTRSELQRKLDGLVDKDRYQVLVLGTSRTFEAIHPLSLRQELGVRVFKEAFQGKGPRYYYEFYQLYKKSVGVPRLIIWGVDYFIFNIESDALKMGRFSRRDAPINFPTKQGPLLMVANKAANEQALLAYLRKLQRGLLPQAQSSQFDPDINVRDMEKYAGNTLSKVRTRREPAGYEKYGFRRFPGEEGEYLMKLLRQWEAEGVGVMLVALPDFIGTYRSNYETDEFVRAFQDIAAQHRHCVFLNYNDPARFPLTEPTLFVDGDYGNPNSHLSLGGVREFDRLFIPDVRKMWQSVPAR